MVNVVDDMVLMGAKMIRTGMENEAEMWKRIMIDAGLMTDAKSTAMNTETETVQRGAENDTAATDLMMNMMVNIQSMTTEWSRRRRRAKQLC